MIEIDGSHGEGGGQIVRTALALGVLTQKPFRVINIRKGREQAGLKAQHLEAINALKQICDAKTNEVTIGSTELEFFPGKIKEGEYNIDIGTAGSIALLLQAVLLPCMFADGKVKLTIMGGTAGKWQAPVEYLRNVLVPYGKRFVKELKINLIKRGYYPKGGGRVEVVVNPKYKLEKFNSFEEFLSEIRKIKKIDLAGDFELLKINGVSAASLFLANKKVAERQAQAAKFLLKKNFNCSISVDSAYQETFSTGSEVVLWATLGKEGDSDELNPCVVGADALGELKKSAEAVGEEAARKLVEELKANATVDENLQDQLLLFMALLPESRFRFHKLTEHAKTNMFVIEKFLDVRFKAEGNILKVEG